MSLPSAEMIGAATARVLQPFLASSSNCYKKQNKNHFWFHNENWKLIFCCCFLQQFGDVGKAPEGIAGSLDLPSKKELCTLDKIPLGGLTTLIWAFQSELTLPCIDALSFM